MKDIKYLDFSMEVKDVDENGMIRGFASTFGNIDQGFDIVDKGAFKKTLQETRGHWPVLAFHDPTKQIGWNLRGEETSEGLFVESQLDLNVQTAREQHSLAKKALSIGTAMGLSIGFTTIKAEPDRENPRIRHLKELKLWEHSITPFPMNTMATITGAKSWEARKKIEHLFQHGKELGLNEGEIKEALLSFEGGTEDVSGLVQSLDSLGQLFKKEAANLEDPALLCQSVEAMKTLFQKSS